MNKSDGKKLKFKGGFNKYLKETQSKLKKEIRDNKRREYYNLFGDSQQEKELIEVTFPIERGTGRIISSDTVVEGRDTKFTKELRQFDSLIVMNPQTLVKEESQISTIVSDTSLVLTKPFENDLLSFSAFEFQKKAEFNDGEECVESQFVERFDKIGKKIKKFTPHEYRAKKGTWTYQQIKEKVEGDATREQLLERRIKNVRDKFCWF